MRTFTVQEVVDMGATLYDSGYSRSLVYQWLTALDNTNMIQGKYNIDSLFDLIIG